MNHPEPELIDIHVLFHTIEITIIVFLMMVIIDWIDVQTRGKIPQWINRHKTYQYIISCLLGLSPGCMGAYMNVSLYMHGYLSLGAIVGGMIATSGEASLVMFALFPGKAFIIHILLLMFALVSAFITDYLLKQFNIEHKCECPSIIYHQNERSINHYLREHIWQHIIRKHIWKIFLWTFFAIWIVHIGMGYFDLSTFIKDNPHLLFLFAIIIGFIPDVSPQFIFVFLYHEGLIPFSVLLASSIVQNGHALLPLLSYSIRDAIIIKSINVLFGLIIGLLFIIFGL